MLIVLTTITVHGQNKLLSSVSQYLDGNSVWQNSNGSNYEYDSNNNLIAETYLSWNSAAWEINAKDSYTYNASNKITESIYQSWNTTTNTLENSYKDTYTYTSGKLTEMIYYVWTSPNWVNDGKSVITYNGNNLPVNLLSYVWDGTQWILDQQETLTYNANNKITSYLSEKWVSSQWVNDYKTLYTYDANNKLISDISATWDAFNSIWAANGDKTEYELDATGNRIRETDYTSSGNNYQNKDEYSYDTFSLMSSFANPFKDKTGIDYLIEDEPHINKVQGYDSYSYNQLTSSYTLSSRTTYDYNNAITLGIEQAEIAIDKITVFPNPTKDFLSIQNASNTTIDKVIVTDMTGKTVLQQNHNTSQLNVQNLAKGMYLLQFSSGGKKGQSKFLKE